MRAASTLGRWPVRQEPSQYRKLSGASEIPTLPPAEQVKRGWQTFYTKGWVVNILGFSSQEAISSTP